MQFKVPQNIDMADPSTLSYCPRGFVLYGQCDMCGAGLIGNERQMGRLSHAV